MLYRLMWTLLALPIRLYWRVTPVDRGNVPKGPAIIACNHRSAIDPILVCVCFLRNLHWLAKVELVKNRRVAWFFRMVQVVPVDRRSPDERWLAQAEKILRKRRLFGIFPEGTRSPDGRVYKGYTGVARLAARTGRPVVPTAVIGSDRSHQKGRRFAKPERCEVRFGAPMYFDQYPGEDESTALRRFTDEVLDEVARLAGVERVRDRYSRERAAPATRSVESAV